jgi:molybdopterin converting factor subunit 1
VNVRVRLFAALRERVGRSELEWELGPGQTVGELWSALCAAFPELRSAGRVAFAVNREYVDTFYYLTDNDEVAVIPPVSGGTRR